MLAAANDNEATTPLTDDIHAMRARAANDFAPPAADEAEAAESDSDQKAN